MYRTLLDFPALGLHLRPAETFVLLAIAVVLFVGPAWAERLEGLDRRAVRRAMLVLAVCVLIGGRLHFLLNYPQAYAGRPLEALILWRGGQHIPGGILALALAAPFVARRFGLPLGRFGDALVPSIGVGIAIVRTGCFLQGCCFGSLSSYPWSVTFPADSSPHITHEMLGLLAPGATRSLAVHPLQLYYVAAGLALTAVALWLRPRKRYDGQVALVGLLLFSLLNVAGLEVFRGETSLRVYWGPLPQLMWSGLAMGAATAGLLLALAVRQWRAARLGRAVGWARSTPRTESLR